jgi:hypothetical protein
MIRSAAKYSAAGIGRASLTSGADARDRMIVGGKNAKIALGLLLTLLGLLIVSGLDKRLESFVVENSPQWLTDLTTRF